jgi:hypothetical protein
MFKIKHNHPAIARFAQSTQQILAQRLLANLQIVGGVLGDSGWQSVGVAWGESGLESVQKQKEIVGLVQGI